MKKYILSFLFFIYLLYPVPTFSQSAGAIGDAVAGAIADLFKGLAEDATKSMTDKLKDSLLDGQNPDDLDFNTTIENELENIYNRTQENSTEVDNILNNDPILQRNIDTLLNQILSQFKDSGYFNNELDTFFSLTEAQFREMLKNLYINDVYPSIQSPDTGLPAGAEEKIEIYITPSNPQPGDLVSVEIKSYGTELNSAYFNWTAGGKNILTGLGALKLQNYKINEEGTPEYIDVTIQKRDGGVINKTVVITSSIIDLIYEPNTTSHPFYKGKPYFTHESIVKFIALPKILDNSGREVPLNTLKFKWSINNSVVKTNTQVGNNILYFNSPFISEPIYLDVEIRSIYTDLFTRKSVYLEPGEPMVMLYEDNPIYGTIYEKAINDSTDLQREELTLKAVPFSFNPTNILEYDWFMNNSNIENTAKDKITLRNEGKSGSANISLQINNLNKRLQNAVKNITIVFNN